MEASWHSLGSGQEQIEGIADEGFQFLAMDDGVEKTMLEQELGALESFGKLLANGLLDDAGAGEADERAGLRDVEVAEHGEAGGDAAGTGNGDERLARFDG